MVYSFKQRPHQVQDFGKTRGVVHSQIGCTYFKFSKKILGFFGFFGFFFGFFGFFGLFGFFEGVREFFWDFLDFFGFSDFFGFNVFFGFFVFFRIFVDFFGFFSGFFG